MTKYTLQIITCQECIHVIPNCTKPCNTFIINLTEIRKHFQDQAFKNCNNRE